MENKSVLSYQSGASYNKMMEYLEIFSQEYTCVEVANLGRSFMGKRIPIVTLGNGECSLVYVGTMCGREYLTGMALLSFIHEYCEAYSRNGKMYNKSVKELYNEKTIYIIPMFDVDGMEYAINGIKDKNELYDKLCNGEEDFAPERGALNNFVRFNDSVKAVLTFRQQKEKISFFSNAKNGAKAMSIAKRFSKLTGFSIDSFGESEYSESIFYDFDVPCFSLRCGEVRGKHEKDALFSIYSNARKILFGAPFVI